VAPALAELPAADVLIVGGGVGERPMPLYAVDAALALGAASVSSVDTDPRRLEVAQALGAGFSKGRPSSRWGCSP
jgi:alcohol dehydrogenase